MPELTYQDLPIRVEFRPGSRRPYGPPEKKLSTLMKAYYGEISGTEGADGDPVDVYLAPDLKVTPDVYVVKQMRVGDWERFDEEKVMLGCSSAADAKALYLEHYGDPRFCGAVKTLTMAEFKKRLETRGMEGKKLARHADLAFTLKQAGEGPCAAPEKKDYAKLLQALEARRNPGLPEHKTAGDRVQRIADHVDEAGLALMAAPHVVSGLGNMLAGRSGRIGAVGHALQEAGHVLETKYNNKIHTLGLAMVAPSLSHGAARHIAKVVPEKTAALEKLAAELNPGYEDFTETEKVAYLGALRALGTTIARGAKTVGGLVADKAQLARQALRAPVPGAAPASMARRTLKVRDVDQMTTPLRNVKALGSPGSQSAYARARTAPALPAPAAPAPAITKKGPRHAAAAPAPVQAPAAAPVVAKGPRQVAAPAAAPVPAAGPAAPAAAAVAPTPGRAPLLGRKNLAKAAILGTGVGALYAGKKVVDTAGHVVSGQGEPNAIPGYQAPRIM